MAEKKLFLNTFLNAMFLQKCHPKCQEDSISCNKYRHPEKNMMTNMVIQFSNFHFAYIYIFSKLIYNLNNLIITKNFHPHYKLLVHCNSKIISFMSTTSNIPIHLVTKRFNCWFLFIESYNSHLNNCDLPLVLKQAAMSKVMVCSPCRSENTYFYSF